MQLKLEALGGNLRQGLKSSYLLAGSEPLLVLEAAAEIRAAARAAGAGEREVFDVLPGFDWNDFRIAAQSMGLFAQQRLLEVRLSGARMDNAATSALVDYLERPDPHAVLLVTYPEWGRTVEQSAWAKALDSAGVVVPIWPLRPNELPRWLGQRARTLGLKLSADALEALTERVEGNLLAAAQELDLLNLLARPNSTLDRAAIDEIVSDSARFDIFKLSEAMLSGDGPRAVRVLRGLRAEDAEAVPVCSWLLTQLDQLCRIARLVDQGTPAGAACSKAGLREWNQQPFLRAIKRGDGQFWEQRYREAAEVDLVLKGRSGGSPWLMLERWLLRCTVAPGHVGRFAA